METSRSLCNCLSLMDIMRLKMTSTSSHQSPHMGGLPMPISFCQNSSLDLVLIGQKSRMRGLIMPPPLFLEFCGPRASLCWRPQRLRCEIERRGNFKWVNADYFSVFDFPLILSVFLFVFLFAFFFILTFSDFPVGLFFFSFDSPFLIVSSLVHLTGYSCRGSTRVVRICLSWLQCNYLTYFHKIGFLDIPLR